MSKYCHKDFTSKSLQDEADLLSPQTIVGSCFSQENPNTHVFPDSMVHVTFINCNLDNVFIPDGNLVSGGSQRKYAVQADGRDWNLDVNDKPVTPVNEDQNLSSDPRDIPGNATLLDKAMQLLGL